MADLLSLFGVSFFLGLRHATDPDHVVAVSAIVAREGTARAAVAVGALWGLGHTLTVLAIGGAIALFGLVVPPRLGLMMEMSVAAMLIVLGAVNLRSALGRREPIGHGEHAHHASWPAKGRKLFRTARPIAVGVMHGLAGSAAVALLVLATARSVHTAIGYLLVFGVGTVLGMMLVTALIARPLARTGTWPEARQRAFVRVTGIVSVAVGLFLVYRVGVVDGLFTAAPSWTPR